jgi:hypothetical protein
MHRWRERLVALIPEPSLTPTSKNEGPHLVEQLG